MSVVKPEASGPGGDLFALVYMKKTGKVEAINSSGPAPAKASIDYFRERGLKAIPQSGALSIAVPGAVDGWLELHKKYATKEVPRLMADAIRIAREGFPISQEFAESIEEFSSEFPWVDRCYRQPLGSLTPGKTLRQKGLGDVLEKIAQKGRDGFYAGEVADKICATVKAEGGILALEDLQPTVCQWLEPLSSTYRDGLVFEQPPVSQGFMVLEMLNIVEPWRFNDGSMSRADMLHYQVAAKKLAFEDRIRYLEDPRFGDPKISTLISKDYAAKRRDLVDDAMNRPSAKVANQSSDTTYLCAADRDGNAISFIQSVFAPFGSRVIAGDSGVVMNNRLCSFGLDPSKANSLKPGKRPAHTSEYLHDFPRQRSFCQSAAVRAPTSSRKPIFKSSTTWWICIWIRRALSKRRAGATNRGPRRAISCPRLCASKRDSIRRPWTACARKVTRFRWSIAGPSAARK